MSTKRKHKTANTADLTDSGGFAMLLNQAVAFHRQGKLAQAEAFYRAVLAKIPDQFDALHMLGLIHYQKGAHIEALALLRKASEIKPQDCGPHSNIGLVHQRLGANADALTSFSRAIALNPRFAEACNNRGILLLDLGDCAGALADFDAAISLRPNYPEALNNRGNALRKMGKPDAALASYEASIRLSPNYGQAQYNCGVVLEETRRFEQALKRFDELLRLYPAYREAHGNRANVLRALNRHAEALEAYHSQLRLDPESAEVLTNIGNVLLQLRRPAEAIAKYDQALALKPDHAYAYNNRGNALQALDRLEEALSCYQQALNLKPDYVEASINRGNAFSGLLMHAQAIEDYQRALAIDSENADAHWNKAIVLLSCGNFPDGWPEYEYRWHCSGADPVRPPHAPEWRGAENLDGKAILLYAEQGLGDTLQFARFATQVAALGARVMLEVPSELKRILQTIPELSLVFAKGEPVPPCDFQCPLLSLPLALGTAINSIPFRSGYLAPPAVAAAEWAGRLGAPHALRVGMVWRGNSAHKNDSKRSIGLSTLSKLLDVDGCHFFGLQKDISIPEQTVLNSTSRFTNLANELTDFAETAAVIANLDLVIAVDTAVAHLAGSMGKPTWILLPFAADFRWLLDRSDSPWYSSVRLFRQPQPGNWITVIAAVHAELELFAKSVSTTSFSIQSCTS